MGNSVRRYLRSDQCVRRWCSDECCQPRRTHQMIADASTFAGWTGDDVAAKGHEVSLKKGERCFGMSDICQSCRRQTTPATMSDMRKILASVMAGAIVISACAIAPVAHTSGYGPASDGFVSAAYQRVRANEYLRFATSQFNSRG